VQKRRDQIEPPATHEQLTDLPLLRLADDRTLIALSAARNRLDNSLAHDYLGRSAWMKLTPPRFTPPRVIPPAAPLNRLAFIATFVRNPLQVAPQAVYDEDFVSFGGASAPRVWVTAPALIKAVLLDEREKFHKITQIRLLSPLLGKGILTSEGADWKWQRQASAPMFRQQDLMGFVPAFVRAAQGVLAKWRETPQGSVRRVDEDMTQATFEVISATLLPSADDTVAPAIKHSVGVSQKSSGWGQLYASMNVPGWFPRPGMLAGRRAVHTLRSAVAAMIRDRRELWKNGGREPDDLMHRLIAARDPETGQSMNDEQLIDNLLTFYLAGHETTAKALTWTLYLLARSPEWAAALEEEVSRVTGGAALASEHIDRLVLVQQVLKESMRLYPPVPIMSRQAVADAQIGAHRIRAGTSVLIPIYVIHRHTRRWEDPDAFDPGRFALEREAKMPRYQYMPFGAGPRICIGMAFALIEATAMLAALLQHARFAPVEGHEPWPVARVTLIPKGGMPLKVWTR
jgi:cytochrome P450